MKRLIVRLMVIAAITVNAQTVQQTAFCNYIEEVMQEDLDGVELIPTYNTLTILIPINTFAKDAGMSNADLRRIVSSASGRELLGQEFMHGLGRDGRTIFKEQGFTYIVFAIEDYNRTFRSEKLNLSYTY